MYVFIMYVHVRICMNARIWMNVCIRTVGMYKDARMYACIFCLYACMYVCKYECKYVCTVYI